MGEAGKPLPRKKIRLAESFWVYITLFCRKFRICRESRYYLGFFLIILSDKCQNVDLMYPIKYLMFFEDLLYPRKYSMFSEEIILIVTRKNYQKKPK